MNQCLILTLYIAFLNLSYSHSKLMQWTKTEVHVFEMQIVDLNVHANIQSSASLFNGDSSLHHVRWCSNLKFRIEPLTCVANFIPQTEYSMELSHFKSDK